MTYSWEYASDDNVALLNDDGTAMASVSEDRFVILKEISSFELRLKYDDFRMELYNSLYDLLALTPNLFAAAHGDDRYKIDEAICAPHSCVAFKKSAAGSNMLAWLRRAPVVEALIDQGHVPSTTPQGKPRKNAIRGEGGAPEIAQAIEYEEQQKVLGAIIFESGRDLDDILSILGQASVFGLPELEAVLRASDDVEELWTRLVQLFSSFMNEQQASRSTTSTTAKGQGRRFAVPWFLAYLAREGIAWWPVRAASNSEHTLPWVLKPLLWTFWTPENGRDLARAIAGPDIKKPYVDYVRNVFRDLLLTTNFFNQSGEFRDEHLLHIKAQYSLDSDSNGHRKYGANLIYRASLKYHDLSYEDQSERAEYFGGGRRLTSHNGRDAFGWVDAPRLHKMKKYRDVFGCEPPERFPDYVVESAAELRSLLPHLNGKHVVNKIRDLDVFLFYLISVGEEYAPRIWEDIDRQRHINAMGNPAFSTFLEFVRTKHKVAAAQNSLSTLKQVWTLAAIKHGFGGRIACPIDQQVDVVDRRSNPNINRSGRTRRKAIDPFVLEILIEENRRKDADGNWFAFGRSLGRLYRSVVDAEDGQPKAVFWPALPILLDVLLNMGARKGMTQWMDSGEGDEVWVDTETLSERRNPLPMATEGRRMGFLRLVQINNSERVLGSYFAINKSGPYEIPWIDPITAQFVTMMRDWQVRYFPRKSTVLATRDPLMKEYAGEELVAAVYPLYRDPDSKGKAYPPSDEMLYRYFRELLRHCEPIVNKRLRAAAEAAGRPYRPVTLLDENGDPWWDIHSLRVTTVTTLLDAGVSPAIVQLLVGHVRLAMTERYREVNNQKMHEALNRGMERRRQMAVAEFSTIDVDDDPEEFLARWLGGLVNLRGSEKDSAQRLKDLVISKRPGAYEVYADGICPGGDCETGGEMYKNAYRSVFRPRACSGCRWRLTGPVFLNGLEHRLNCLMVEIDDSIRRAAHLNAEIESAEDAGASASILENLVRRELEFRDHLWAEWCAELLTIRRCEDLMRKKGENGKLPLITGMGDGEARKKLETVHQLELLHIVVSEADMITGASLTVPMGMRERRDEMFLEIARRNNSAGLFYELEPTVRKVALDGFGECLRALSAQRGGDQEGSDFIESLLQGTELVPELRQVAEKMCRIASDGSGTGQVRH